jgi:geranylgeranyl diphosphate synthase type I
VSEPQATLAARVERYRALVDAELRSAVGSDPAPLYALMRYHLGWAGADGALLPASPGKRLRSTLLLLVAELCGSAAATAAPAAAAVELVHNFSLLHDDVEDESAERRGRATVWALAGTALAINAGDGMHALARPALQRLRAHVPDQRVLEAMAELDRACVRLVEGQHLDLEFERRVAVGREEYLAMAAGKSGALFAAAAAIGAIVAGASDVEAAALRAFGERLGLAFQAIDDVLGIWGDPLVTGKPAGDDLRSRKMTLPVIATLEAGGAAAGAVAAAYAGPPTREGVAALARVIEEAGGRARTEQLARAQLEAGYAALTAAHFDAGSVALLRELAERAVDRSF